MSQPIDIPGGSTAHSHAAPQTISVNVLFPNATTRGYTLTAPADADDLRNAIADDHASPFSGTDFTAHPIRVFNNGVQLGGNTALVNGGTYHVNLHLIAPAPQQSDDLIFQMDQ